jgi:hypothetical protein
MVECDDGGALAPIPVAAQLYKVPEPELRSRAESAGLLIRHPRGAMIRLGDARKLTLQVRPEGASEKPKRRGYQKFPKAPPEDQLMPPAEVAAALGISASDLLHENIYYAKLRPPLCQLPRSEGSWGRWAYAREAVETWLAAHPEAGAILRDRAEKRRKR